MGAAPIPLVELWLQSNNRNWRFFCFLFGLTVLAACFLLFSAVFCCVGDVVLAILLGRGYSLRLGERSCCHSCRSSAIM